MRPIVLFCIFNNGTFFRVKCSRNLQRTRSMSNKQTGIHIFFSLYSWEWWSQWLRKLDNLLNKCKPSIRLSLSSSLLHPKILGLMLTCQRSMTGFKPKEGLESMPLFQVHWKFQQILDSNVILKWRHEPLNSQDLIDNSPFRSCYTFLCKLVVRIWC